LNKRPASPPAWRTFFAGFVGLCRLGLCGPKGRETLAQGIEAFKNSYVIEFLDLPGEHTKSDLHRGLSTS